MINVGRLVTNPKFCTKFKIITKTGTWEKGAFVTTEKEKTVTGVALPVSGRALEMVPEADRLKDYMTFYSTTKNPLTVSSDGTISDSVIYEGKRYKLINGQNFSKQGFWKAMGINEDGK